MTKRNLLVNLLVAALIMVGVAAANTLTIRPNAQGYYSGWTNSGCKSNSEWECVDEDSANITDNLYTSSKNVYESFAFQDTGLTNEVINSVTLYFYGQRYSSTRYQFQPLIRSGGTNYLGSVKSLTSNYNYYTETYTTNPATGSAWTIAEVNSLEAGMKSYSSNYGGIIAQVYAVVDYNPAEPDSCSDTDGGNVITILGTVSGYFNNVPYSNSDYCVNTGNIMEYFCNGAYKQSQQQSCGTDGYEGNNYCMNGDVYRDYTDYYCVNGACYYNTTAVLQQDCTSGQYCSNGECIWEDSCFDTDGGNIITILGTTYGFLNNVFYLSNDTCVDSESIIEYFCNGAYKQSQQQSCGTDGYQGNNYCMNDDVYRNYVDYYCSGGKCNSYITPVLQQNCTSEEYCSNGECLLKDTCTDTDTGYVPETFGSVMGYFNQEYYTYSDYCIDSTTLMEYTCFACNNYTGSCPYSSSTSCITNYTTTCYNGQCI